MRRLPALMIVVLLFGCGADASGGSDEAFRTEFKQNAVRACVDQSRTAAPPGTEGLDWQRFCGCAADRFMEGKSTDELRTARDIGSSDRPALEQCAAEMQSAGIP